MNEEYPLTIFDLEEGKEYILKNETSLYFRRLGSSIESRYRNEKKWRDAAWAMLKSSRFKPKKTLRYYRHWYINSEGELDRWDTVVRWEDANHGSADKSDYLETVILKEIEVDQ